VPNEQGCLRAGHSLIIVSVLVNAAAITALQFFTFRIIGIIRGFNLFYDYSSSDFMHVLVISNIPHAYIPYARIATFMLGYFLGSMTARGMTV
jgi:hypothetical protein